MDKYDNHSTGYSMIGYACGYLRYYYPTEFVTSYLNNANTDADINDGTALAKQLGIKIESVKFRHSLGRYSCNADTKTIYKGIASIKFLNETVANELYELRNEHFNSFVSLLVRLNATSINSRQLEILIKLDFFSEFGEPNALLAQNEMFNKLYGKKQLKKELLAEWNIPASEIAKFCESETEKIFKNYSIEAIEYICSCVYQPKTSLLDKIKYEQELYGYISIVVPDEDKRNYFVQDVSCKQYITYITLYELCSGIQREVKMWTKAFSSSPIDKNSIIRITALDKKHKKEFSGQLDENGKRIYVDTPEWEYWLSKYTEVKNYV